MSLWGATSLDVIDVQEIISIKSTNLNETEKGRKDSASFFHRYMVHKAAYVTYGSIYCQLAEKIISQKKMLKNTSSTNHSF